jgi:murein endopeptidase
VIDTLWFSFCRVEYAEVAKQPSAAGARLRAFGDSLTHYIAATVIAGLAFAAIGGALADPDLVTPAKVLFAKPALPSDQPLQVFGGYAKGCLAGAQPLPIDGPHWQVMRLSRNRHWGTPRLVNYLEKFSNDAGTLDGWPGS